MTASEATQNRKTRRFAIRFQDDRLGLCEQGVDQRAHRCTIGHAADARPRPATETGDLIADRLQFAGGARDQYNFGTGSREHPCDRSANPSPGAGHQRDPSCQRKQLARIFPGRWPMLGSIGSLCIVLPACRPDALISRFNDQGTLQCLTH